MDEDRAAGGEGDIRTRAGFIISGLAGAHAVFHAFSRSFQLMLPEVQDTFKLSEVGVGGISATRELASGLITLPGGVLADVFRRYWGHLLMASMAGFGLGWLIMGLSPVYPLLIVGMAVVSLTSSIWHLPAMAALSHHFPERRGITLSLHGVGGNVGDVVAPPLTGLVLLYFGWQGIISVYSVGPLLLTFVVFWAFKDIGRTGPDHGAAATVRSQIELAKPLMTNPVLWGIALVEALREMALVPFDTFLPLYLDNDVGMGPLARGLHIGLLVAIGTVTTPVMGYVSDRIGRKQVLVPVVVALSGLTFLMVPFGTGAPLTLIIALLGLFLYADQPILTAAALDIVGRGVAATTLGVLSFYRFALSAASPLIAGYLYNSLGSDAFFFYVGALLALAAAVLMVIPLRRPVQPATSEHTH